MIQFNNKINICFDDILLVPQFSNISTRKDISLTMNGYSFPVIASPMDTVCEWKMASTIANYGGIGIIHRYMDTSERLIQIEQATLNTNNKGSIGVAISAIECFETEFIDSAIELGAKWFCIDTANGHGLAAINATKHLSVWYPGINIMVGNVSTAEGYSMLSDAGATAIRVGIGGGATCKTRIVTGHGMPTLQSIIDCYEYKNKNNIDAFIVADGGIKNSGDIVKSFAAGADFVMLGSMLAGTEESPGNVIDGKKKFRGMASSEAQINWRGSVSVDEGISTMIEYKGTVNNILDEIKGGISSGCSYSGVDKLQDLSESSMYILVSSMSKQESSPHSIKD